MAITISCSAGLTREKRRPWKLFGLLLVSLVAAPVLQGQTSLVEATVSALLPDSPGARVMGNLPRRVQAVKPAFAEGVAGTATISGSVVDSTGAAVPTARIVLNLSSGAVAGTIEVDERGGFLLRDVPAGQYRVTVAAAGFQTLVAPDFHLNASEALALGPLELAIAGTRSDVEVNVTEHSLAAEQMKEAMHQRTLGVLPNYYSSYIWNAAPLDAGQKMKLGLYSTLDPASFLTAGITAGVEQARNTYPGYGQGAQGYGKRYGSALAGHIVATMIGRAILPSVFHQDPRYFYLGPGSRFGTRFRYALSRAVVARGDNGHWQPAYALVLGGFASGAVAYGYHPATDRGPYLIARNGLVNIGARAVTNLIREFVLRSISTNVPDFEKGKPPPIVLPAAGSPIEK